MMLQVEAEQPDHHGAVRRVTREAFAASGLGHHGEAELVESLRANCPDCVSLVAIVDGDVVGHVLFSPTKIRCGDREVDGMGLGPMAVLPRCQRRGIGSPLVQAGLAELKGRGMELTVVIGHPDFYQRFGFVPATPLGIEHGFEGIPQEFLLLRCEGDAGRDGFGSGRVFYRPEFGRQFSPA